jgi:hypothetical protein
MVGKTSDVGSAAEQRKHNVAAEGAEGLKKKFHDLKVCPANNMPHQDIPLTPLLPGRRGALEASGGEISKPREQQSSP